LTAPNHGKRYQRFSVTDSLIKKELPKNPHIQKLRERLARNPNLTSAGVTGLIDGRFEQFGWAEWSDRAADAPILHFDGPLTLRPWTKLVLPRRQKPAEVSFYLVTAGLGEGKPFIQFTEHSPIPRILRLVAEFEFPSKKPAASPIKLRIDFRPSAHLGGAARVPAEAAEGKGKVTVSIADSKNGHVAPATFDVLVVDKLKNEASEPAGRDMERRDLLNTKIKFAGIDDPEKVFSEALKMLEKPGKLTFMVNEQAFQQDKAPAVLKTRIAERLPLAKREELLSTALRRILERIPAESGATYLIRDDHIEITTQRAARAELRIPVDRPFPTLIYEEFENEPCADALRIVSTRGEVSLAVDRQVEQRAKDVCLTARLHNVPAETAVRLLVDMAGLGLARLDNVFYVTTREKAARIERDSMHR